MKKFYLAATLALGLFSIANPAAAAKSDCDRKCLAGKLDQFLSAVVAKDPSKANLWVGFRQTQNAVLDAPGEGIWKSNTGIGALDRRYYDPETQQAEFFGEIKEGDKPAAIVSLRIKLHDGDQKISEAEWHIARAGDPGITGDTTRSVFGGDNLLKHPPEQRVVPVGERRPRDELIAAVNSYFDAIVAGSGRYVQGNPGCYRLENGTGGPASPTSTRKVIPADADFQTAPDCRSDYSGLGIVNVAGRRYLMVDDEAQMVLASCVFIRTPHNPKRRNHFMELFFMDGGKISRVYAAMVYADPKLPMPNWAPYEGNFPISEDLIAH